MTTLQRTLEPAHSKENTMNRSFTALAGVASIALELMLSTQISSAAQISTSDQISAPAKIGAPTKITAPAKFRSPVKERSKYTSGTMPTVAFSACRNTRENMTRAEAKDIPIISEAKVVNAGVGRLMELQERGWSYLRP